MAIVIQIEMITRVVWRENLRALLIIMIADWIWSIIVEHVEHVAKVGCRPIIIIVDIPIGAITRYRFEQIQGIGEIREARIWRSSSQIPYVEWHRQGVIEIDRRVRI